MTWVERAARATFGGRSRRELAFCAAVLPIGLGLPLVAFLIEAIGAALAGLATVIGAGPLMLAPLLAGLTGIVLLILSFPGLALRLGALERRILRRLLGVPIEGAALTSRRSRWGALAGGWRDPAGRRAALYLLVKMGVTAAGLYAVAGVLLGLADLSYPIWWPLFRNHPAGVRLSPVWVITWGVPFRIDSWPGTLKAAAAGLAMLLAGLWLVRAVNLLDVYFVRRMLGPPLAEQRIHDLERSRAFAVDDAADQIRRLERNLHDGAQMRLAALAMDLGRTRERLGGEGQAVTEADLDRARALVDGAHAGAKEALAELRVLVRGLHPPVLDQGLADALATLVAQSPVPATLEDRLSERPSPAIATIAYFCAAELLTNTAKHARATAAAVRVSLVDGRLRLEVVDDGVGGADPARGSGLTGLRERARTVDGEMDVDSPAGGPTRVRVDLPLRAGGGA